MSFTRTHSSVWIKYSADDISLLYFLDSSFVGLGITFVRVLSFNAHIDIGTCKTLKMLDFVKIIPLEFKLYSSLKSLHCALFARSHLEYGVVIWNPCILPDTCQLERVKLSFLGYVSFALKEKCPSHDYLHSTHMY